MSDPEVLFLSVWQIGQCKPSDLEVTGVEFHCSTSIGLSSAER
jgi:hypothetical protein